MAPRSSAAPVETVPRVAWPAFVERLTCRRGCKLDNVNPECPAWHQGEHVSLIGPTGGGKSTLGIALLHLRGHVVVVGTKARDATLDRLTRQGYRRITKWPPPWGRTRVLFWPRIRTRQDIGHAVADIGPMLDDVFAAGAWCVFVDEAGFLCKKGLGNQLEAFWTQGRSLGISLMAATQRPAWVPLYMYDQPEHLFFWRDNDETNLRRVGSIGGLSALTIRQTVAGLPKHDVLYVNSRTGEMLITRVER